MLKQLSRLAALLLIAALLPACSWFKEKPPEYMLSEEVEPLSVPADLNEPVYRAPLLAVRRRSQRPRYGEVIGRDRLIPVMYAA